MSKTDNYLFHIGGEQLINISNLPDDYEYRYLQIGNNLEQQLSHIQQLKSDEINNSKNIFILSKESVKQLHHIDLLTLPCNQIFYESLDGASTEEIRILDLKGAQSIDLSDNGEYISKFIKKNYGKPWGTSLDNSRVEIDFNFDGTITKKGVSLYILEGDFGSKYHQFILWKNTFKATGNINFYSELFCSEAVDYYWRAYYKTNNESHIIEYVDIYPEQLINGQVPIDLGLSEFPVNFGLFIKGSGTLKVGDIHIRYQLPEDNFLAMGGKRLCSPDNMREELGYYFNPGDLKPPLNVYFSGFRPSEGYEGRWMMGSLGAPFILVYDPRLVGGSFYRGSGLEEQLINVIKNKLNILHFSNHDLILSGLSMGTYASFYYGSELEPHAIIVGKPLANIGELAVQSRIFSPYDWDLAMDTLIHLTGYVTQQSAQIMDDEFWNKFEQADFSDTTFIIAHMLQDTDKPFKRIFYYLKKNYPTAKVLHKGLDGRHNDDTPGITSWFYKQYQQLLISDFHRKLTVVEDLKEEPLKGDDNE